MKVKDKKKLKYIKEKERGRERDEWREGHEEGRIKALKKEGRKK